ncbi:hypothetical protein ZIOFF_022166 [Zingiber officinale]|uniref:DNA-repair protein Xrcc1 N-terminal domain-containing protein n=1 Tax=Zingiber officinale TaxID=94328 RepID=A0A8J5L932_ZINOF|nr:hypothetical protein ZIOFF_022166 [Zingiber officinale]
MDMETEPRAKPLSYKIKAMSRESPSQKASNVLDPDLRTHWSTGTNTKEWILLELDEACLLSQIRIYNKSVLEWEITVGLRFKPDTFLKVRPRCEAPRREMIYPMNHTPCRYVRISCLRGNPIAIFFIQLVGVTVTGLEPEFQPIANYLLPNIVSHKHDCQDIHLQLLQDVAKHLLFFLPQLETDLTNFSDAAETSIRFFAMLAGPFYPILHLSSERNASTTLLCLSDLDASKSNPSSTLTVSSNFEAQPRRSRSPPFPEIASSSIVFRPDSVIALLRKAYKDSYLGIVCRKASKAIHRLMETSKLSGEGSYVDDSTLSSVSEEIVKSEANSHVELTDYSTLFGPELKLPDDQWDASYLNVLDVAAVEEGILHVLFGCASQPLLCCKLADSNSNFGPIFPLIQALLPALRPPISSPLDQVDDSFSQWKHPSVHRALSQAKAACVLIDLCSGPLSPWIPTITAKVDLAIELIEDLLGVIQSDSILKSPYQNAPQSIARARSALKYILLAISGHVDDVLAKYKEHKHRLLFLFEMLEPFLYPLIAGKRNTISLLDASSHLAKQENCFIALNIIRTALQRPAILPSVESEWRRGSVGPSVLLSVLVPQFPLPLDIDICKFSNPKVASQDSFSVSSPSISCSPDEANGKNDVNEAAAKKNAFEDADLLFVPIELTQAVLTSTSNYLAEDNVNLNSDCSNNEAKKISKNNFQLNTGFFADYFYSQADYLQLVNHQDSVFRASEFERLASDFCSEVNRTPESHEAIIDALLLAAECHVNPFFMMSYGCNSKLVNELKTVESSLKENSGVIELNKGLKNNVDLETIAHLERKRDLTVLQILLRAAKLNIEFLNNLSLSQPQLDDPQDNEQVVQISTLDTESVDAVTFVRQNQTILCCFIVGQLRREQQSSHETLLHSLLFLLHSATELSCPPEVVIDIILHSAEKLNLEVTSLYMQVNTGNRVTETEKLHRLQRRWTLLQKLVIASSGNGEMDHICGVHSGFMYRNLVPPFSWTQKISRFASSTLPLARFLGWLAVSRNAKQCLKEHLSLVSDLSEISSILSIFADELALTENLQNRKADTALLHPLDTKKHLQLDKDFESSNQLDAQLSFQVLFPHLHMFFPNMRSQFGEFGEIILQAVGWQLKCLPSSVVPDLLCWFADLCLWPYLKTLKGHLCVAKDANSLKGYAARNAKAVLLYVLESIIVEHMEALTHEMPRVAHILMSFCRAPYCDVAFLDSVLSLLGPLISYFLRIICINEKHLSEASLEEDFELSNFEELFSNIKCRKGSNGLTEEKNIHGPLMIVILGHLFPDLSFRRKKEVIESLLLWVDFTTSEPIPFIYDYICAFQKFINSCLILVTLVLKSFGFHHRANSKQSTEGGQKIRTDNALNYETDSLELPDYDINRSSETYDSVGIDAGVEVVHSLSADEVEEFTNLLEKFISGLFPAVEASWKVHHKLATRLTFTSAKCLLLSKFLYYFIHDKSREGDDGGIHQTSLNDHSSKYWVKALEGLIETVSSSQANHCWQVALVMLDFLFKLPKNISFFTVVSPVCVLIKKFCCHAPKISWRLQSDKWISYLFERGIDNLSGNEATLVDLFCTLLGHSEPEQRAVALQHLGRIIGLNNFNSLIELPYSVKQSLIQSQSLGTIPDSVISILVTQTWDRVTVVALSDPSMLLRTHAMVLLLAFLPFAERKQVQSILVATDSILRGVGKINNSVETGELTRLSLHILASACLYSPAEDITLVPETVWRNLEKMGTSKTGMLNDLEKSLCSALCKLRCESDDAKLALQELLSSGSAWKQTDPKFTTIRESILQVLSSLTSIQSYFDFFSERVVLQAQELEEAEIEVELLKKEVASEDASASQLEVDTSQTTEKENNRLQQIKDEVRSLERAKIREEVVARRQKKLLMRHTRQKRLEEAALREMELLQELDRERNSKVERDVERQRELELERARTRELQYNLDMEKERQIQKEIQRELEQVESGVRPSRREFSSNPNSRSRERYRDRDDGRSRQEANIKSSNRGHDGGTSQTTLAVSAGAPSGPTVVLTGSRIYTGQPLTILQSRDRSSERAPSYEDSIEGNRDSGDTSSIGDSELGLAFDGSPGGFGSAPRHGSRGSKSRSIVERRERDGRREGKWERKHS